MLQMQQVQEGPQVSMLTTLMLYSEYSLWVCELFLCAWGIWDNVCSQIYIIFHTSLTFIWSYTIIHLVWPLYKDKF